jgi:hypothetical protein
MRIQLAVAVGLASALALALSAFSRGGHDLPPPGGELPAPLTTWPGGAAALLARPRLTPAIRLPLDASRRLESRVVMSVPDGQSIDVHRVDGRDVLVWPAGSELDRLEVARSSRGERLLDVRGSRITRDGIVHRAYRPLSDDDPTLFGAEWDAEDGARATAVAAAFHGAMLLGFGFSALERGAIPDQRAASADRYQQLLSCAGCHPRARPETRPDRARAHSLARATDAMGFYVPQYVLRDRAPLEAYRPVDPNAQHRFVTAACGSTALALTGATSVRCPSGDRPMLSLDVRAALAEGDAHARAVCLSRRLLAQRLTPRARRVFAAELAECEEAR